jgi:YVTN family beta-propeller protein
VADNNNLISTIPQDILPGNGTAALPYNSNNGKIYVTNLDSDTIPMIDGSTDKIIDTIPVGIGQMELPMILKMEEYAWPISFQVIST